MHQLMTAQMWCTNGEIQGWSITMLARQNNLFLTKKDKNTFTHTCTCSGNCRRPSMDQLHSPQHPPSTQNTTNKMQVLTSKYMTQLKPGDAITMTTSKQNIMKHWFQGWVLIRVYLILVPNGADSKIGTWRNCHCYTLSYISTCQYLQCFQFWINVTSKMTFYWMACHLVFKRLAMEAYMASSGTNARHDTQTFASFHHVSVSSQALINLTCSSFIQARIGTFKDCPAVGILTVI